MSTICKLSELVTITSGMAFKSSNSSNNGNIAVITSSKLLADSIITDFSDFQRIKALPTRSPAVVYDNDLLIASRATPGASFKASLVKTKKQLVAASSVYILRIQSKFLLPEYLNHYLNSSSFQRLLLNVTKGSTIFHLTKKALGEINIPVPSLEKQRLIIDLKNSISKQILIHKRQQKLKEQAMQAVFNNIYNGKKHEKNNSARA